MNLSEFLLARIAEDEAMARAVTGLCPVCGGTLGYHLTIPHGPGRLPANWSPARILAECEAKRRIVELHKMVTEDYAGEWWTDPAPPGTYVRTGCGNCTGCGVDGQEYINDGPCQTSRLLALPYADHPDYRDEWRP